jgi:hypothetical protein
LDGSLPPCSQRTGVFEVPGYVGKGVRDPASSAAAIRQAAAGCRTAVAFRR